MINIATALAIANSVIGNDYPIIGSFQCDNIGKCSLQESYNLKEWYDIPDELVTLLPNSDWFIDTTIPTTSIYGDIHKKGRMFYRVKGIPNNG